MKEILSRIRSAIDFLKEGLPFRVEDFFLGIDKEVFLNVTPIAVGALNIII